ncbi:ribonuclease E/G [Pararhodospirillum oryzae]|uniref:Ribonuclease G n=1 Tax=Pararhodospirillum oryzae TaxID=478448 RepID=A0A512H9U6_9PROT|nr:ribonuclease E/G [Pararhodospirillum oryzae]GEO82221.1 ribonuclease G [Pararhodospirillum oryzae]
MKPWPCWRATAIAAEDSFTVLVSEAPGETRWALLDARETVLEVVHQRAHRPEAGACLAGRVGKRLPGHRAAFVDVGVGPAGLLDAADTPEGLPPEGRLVLVQITRPAVGDKGPKLSAKIALPGPFLVYTPHAPGIGLGARVGKTATREALRARLAALIEPHEGVIARTSAGAAEVTESHLACDLAQARAAWNALEEAFAAASRPGLLRPAPPPLDAWLTGPGGRAARVVVEGGTRLAEVRAHLAAHHPDWCGVLERHSDPLQALFEAFGVEAALEEALTPGVAVPGGGRVIVAETAAVSAIDVDAGGRDRNAVARAAVAVIAHQIRLRGLAGQIVIDFPRGGGGPDPALIAALGGALALDPAGPRVLGATRGGLVEVNRPRRRAPLSEVLLDPQAPASLTPEAGVLGALRHIAQGRPGQRAHLEVGPRGAGLLNGPLAAALAEAQARLGAPVTVSLRAGADESVSLTFA